MKKWIIFFIAFALIWSLILFNMQQWELEQLPDGREVITNINEVRNVDLNTFLNKYEAWEFDRLKVVDSRELHGLIEISEEEVLQSMAFRQEATEVTYNKVKSFKPEETTLAELGFDVRWETSITVEYDEEWLFSRMFLETLLPLLILILILIFLFRMFAPKWWWGGFPFGSQAGKLQSKDTLKARFKDVAWMSESKWELEEIVDYLKHPTRYKKAWAKIPRWVLLYGPPGSGKTLVARAVAWEAEVPFFTVAGSEFMEMLVGMWASKVRDLFNKAKTSAPAIIFIDEMDTIWKKRGQWATGGHQEQEQTLNQILTEMDGFDKDTNVIVLAATNRPDMLDKALLRPGRFDRKVYVGTPTLEERIEILKVHCKNKKLAKDIDIESIAKRTSGFVWSDLENLMNEAALKTARDRRVKITADDVEYALEKIIMWPEKKIKSMQDKEKEIITYHELWHAITAYNLKNADPVEKISIVSRWMALWVTWMIPKEDKYLHSKAKFLDELVTLLGGRAAEEVVFGKDEVTTWAANDFEKVTEIATDMITKYWMDEELGTISYFSRENKEWQTYRPYSETTTEKIDEKIHNIVSEAYETSKKLINDNKDVMEILARILLEKEYLTKEEFESIMENPSQADQILEEFEVKKKETAQKQKEDEESEEGDEENNDENEGTENTEESDEEKQKSHKKKLEDILDRFLK